MFTVETRSNMRKMLHFFEAPLMAWKSAGLDTETS